MSEQEEYRWMGSKHPKCDFCKDELEGLPFFVDGITKYGGRWGVMCPEDFEKWGVGLGIGLGQKYSGTPPFKRLAGGE
jgi:hypothetical protein